jgi:hypothetical protein
MAAMSPLPELPSYIKLKDEEKPFFEAIVRARARSEWNDANIILAAQLARAQYAIEFESDMLDVEGSVIENARGTMVMNPRHSVVEQLARREMAIMRSLQMVGIGVGKKEDVVKTRQQEAEASKLLGELTEESLLAS